MLDPSASRSRSAIPPGARSQGALAALRLRDAVLRCELAPGSVLHEAELAARYGLGRAGVRGALAGLARDGFVARHPRQGWRVAPVDAPLVAAVVDARRRLDPSLAAWRPAAGEMAGLRALAATVEILAGRVGPEAAAAARSADRRIRAAIEEQADAMARGWLELLSDHGDRILRALERDGAAIAPTPWHALLDAFEAGPAPAAAALIREVERFADAAARGLLMRPTAPEGRGPRLRRRRAARPPAATAPSPAIALPKD